MGNPFRRRALLAPKNPARETCQVAPKPLLCLKTPKLTLSRKMQKKTEGTRRQTQRSDGRLKRSRNLRNLGEALVEPTSMKPWWNLPQNLLAAQGWICPREPETPRETWWNLGGTFVKPWWNLAHGRTLVEPSAEPFGSPRWICPREPQRVRKQFCRNWRPQSYFCWGKMHFSKSIPSCVLIVPHFSDKPRTRFWRPHLHKV